jgi:3-methyladenine DNA glycosylase AlkD
MVPPMLSDLRDELKKYWREDKTDFLQKYFHSDQKQTKEIFRGISVPNSRLVAQKFINLDFNDLQKLLESEVHEERLIALFILLLKYQRADLKIREQIVRFYLKHTKFINDWDLVDSSADRILGDSLLNKNDRTILYSLAKSVNWWERRIAIMATFQFIKVQKNEIDTLKIASLLLHDKHDLIHKSVGWMLREIGKRISPEKEKNFLKKNYKTMPRTMLRYAIEQFPVMERQAYLKGNI